MKLINPHCLLGHHWDGCRCSVCGTPRDAEHDWATDHCHVVCRRCGMLHGWSHSWDGCKCSACGELREEGHEWDGCVCHRCGSSRHKWHNGICYHCAERCLHPKLAISSRFDAGESWGGRGVMCCTICQMEIEPCV